MQCQTTQCTQALSVTLSGTLSMMFFHDAMCISHSVTLSVTPSVTLTESLSVSFFHITIYIRHSVSLSTSHETDIIVYVLCFYIIKSRCIDMLDIFSYFTHNTELN